MIARKRRRAKPRAATSDILGPDNDADAPIPSRWRKHHKRLITLRDHLLQRQGGQAKAALEEQPAFSSHMADAGTDTYDRDLVFGMVSSEQDLLYEIEEALSRLRTGTYGRCELTGQRIEPDRLEALPWTRFSASAAAQLEKEGALKRAQLGPRETVAKTEPKAEEDEEAA